MFIMLYSLMNRGLFFVSLVQQYSDPVLGHPVLNAKTVTVETGFIQKPSVIQCSSEKLVHII